MLLALDKVARFYGPRLVFKDVSLAIRPGTVTLLAGANGAGKSTLLRIMAGLIRPSAGSVIWGKRPRDGESADRNADVSGSDPTLGYLGHQTFLYPDLSALENLRFWSALHRRKFSDHILADMLDRVELGPFAEEKAKGFSRGMAQRLNLARVFLLRPDILLLDEPGTGLDTRSTGILHREIAYAKTSGAGVLWITHNLAEDLVRADMVAVLENKALRFHGTTGEYREQAGLPLQPPFSTPRLATGGEVC